jgi:hypothetical protein
MMRLEGIPPSLLPGPFQTIWTRAPTVERQGKFPAITPNLMTGHFYCRGMPDISIVV